MSCLNGCFTWLSGAKKSQAKLDEDQTQFILLPTKEESGKGFRAGSKGSRNESGRFHYSVTGMQLPDSPIKKGSVKYSITGMPLYTEDPNAKAPPLQPRKSQGGSGKWSENSQSGGKWGANSSSGNKWSAWSTNSKSGGSGKWKANSTSGKSYSNTGMPMPEKSSGDQKLRKQYSVTGMPLN